MEQKIQLKHPAGKKAVTMEAGKYNTLKKSLLHYLKIKGESSHTELVQAITEDFSKNKIKFAGSIEWHLEWVKLDLEARKEITRVVSKSPVRFIATK